MVSTVCLCYFCDRCYYHCYLHILVPLLWRRRWHPTPVLLPGKSHGWRSLEGCSPWGRRESDMTERLHFHFSLSRIGEGNGNPLQCSCLENPRDGRACWAAIYGVAESDMTEVTLLHFTSYILLNNILIHYGEYWIYLPVYTIGPCFWSILYIKAYIC